MSVAPRAIGTAGNFCGNWTKPRLCANATPSWRFSAAIGSPKNIFGVKGGSTQCTLQALPGKIFCGNHVHKQSYGTVDQEMLQVGDSHLQRKVKQEVLEPEGQLVSVEDFAKNQDIDMFLLSLPVAQIQLLSSFSSSYSGPPMKVMSEKPSNFLQFFHHPLAMFLEPRFTSNKPECFRNSAPSRKWPSHGLCRK